MPSAYVRCAASRSPLVQDASPRNAAARAAAEMVVLRDEVERPPGVFHGVGHIAQRQGLSGTVQPRSHPGDGEIPLRPRRPSSGSAMGRPVALAHLPSCPATVRRPAGGPQRPRARRQPVTHGIRHAEHGPGADQLVGERLEPAKHRGLLSAPAHGWHCQLDQVRRAREILGGQRVADRIGRRPILLRTTHWRADAAWVPARAAPPSNVHRAHRQKGGGSDTSGAFRPAARQRSCRAPGPPTARGLPPGR